MDFFNHKARTLERDVHIIIEGSLDAGTRYLDARFDKYSAGRSKIEEVKGREHEDWLIDKHIEVLARSS